MSSNIRFAGRRSVAKVSSTPQGDAACVTNLDTTGQGLIRGKGGFRGRSFSLNLNQTNTYSFNIHLF